MADLKRALARTLPFEGGHGNDPNDAGKETDRGISRVYWPLWQGWAMWDAGNEPPLEMVEDFYADNFWTAMGGAGITSQAVAEAMFDAQVNMNRGVLFAQKAVNKLGLGQLEEDGKMGPGTLRALNEAGTAEKRILQQICASRICHYGGRAQEKTSQGEYLKGWVRRAMEFLEPRP